MTSTRSLQKISICLTALITTLTVAPTPLSATDLTCDDIKVIFARGTGESKSGPNFNAFLAYLKPAFKKHASKLKVSYQELDYPAAGTNNFIEATATAITAGEAFSFNDSVNAGQANLSRLIQSTTATCPTTKFILAGYSQGAMVISKSLPDLKSSQIIYVATFGDPKLYLPEGLGPIPDACSGKNFSNYRQTVPDCHTATGILTALRDYQPKGYKDKLGAWCNTADFICGSYIDLLAGAMKGHTAYSTNGAYQEASEVIIASVKKFFPTAVSAEIKPNYSKRDVAILIDNTGSMESLIDRYSAEALRLARENIEQGGRVALYTYGDLIDSRPEQLTDFTADLTTFQVALEKIKLGDGGDLPESALSGLLHTMNTLKWQKGADKSIVLLTDASYHSPDLDGTTLPQVVQRSLEIDPVNIFIITEAEIAPDYQSLAAATNGSVSISTDSSTITNHLLSRPTLTLDREFYSAPIGSALNFTVTPSTPISRYEWDLDGDGQFETTSASPTISHTYNASLSGYLQVRAVVDSGYYISASAPFRIFDPAPATIKSATATPLVSSARIAFTPVPATLILVNDAPLALTSATSFTITDLTAPATVKLVPISASGQLGTPVTLTATPLDFIPTTPKTGVK